MILPDFPPKVTEARLSVTASAQPFCPRLRKFYSENPDQFKGEVSMQGEIYMSMGNVGHEVLQTWYADNCEVYGDWLCPICNYKKSYCTRPPHKHKLVWREAKYPLAGLERNTKADMVIKESDNLYHLYEFKFVARMPAKPKRQHFLQANLTTLALIQHGLQVEDFTIIYFSFDGKQRQQFRYPFDLDLATIQAGLMLPDCPTEIGICKSPDSWYCDFASICFKDGYQGKWLCEHPDIKLQIEKLYWPEIYE